MDELRNFSSTGDENSWRTPGFRQNMVAKIYDLIQKSGMTGKCNSMEMENHVYQKAKSKEEYLSMVARLILHYREISTKKVSLNSQGMPGLQGSPSCSQPNAVGQNTNQNGPGATQTGAANNATGQGMAADPINALQNLASQGTRNNQMLNNLGPQGQLQNTANVGGASNQVPGMQPQMVPQGTMSQQVPTQQNPTNAATSLLQTLNQRPQMPMQQMQNKMGPGMGMMPNQPMGGNPMAPNQLAGQLVGQMNPNTMQNQMPNTNINVNNVNQMANNNPMAGQINQSMPGQMVGPGQMPNQMGGNMPGNQINMMHMQQRKLGDNMNNMMSTGGGSFQAGGIRGATHGQFLRQSPSPSAPSPAAMGGPSPASIGIMGGPMPSPMSIGSTGVGSGGPVGGVASPALAPSPSSHHSTSQHGQSQQIQPHLNKCIGMASSPSSSLNTPLGAGTAPSPLGGSAGGNDDQAYREKVRQLSKYIDPLRRMIERMSMNEDVEKLTKMKKLLDILSHPNKRMPLETLLKCEVVLEKLDFKRGEGMSVLSQTNALQGAKEHNTIFNPLLEVVNITLQSPVANHTLERTFGPCIEALCGPELRHMPPPLKKQKADEPTPDIPDVLQGEIARLDSRFKVSLEGFQVSTNTGAIRLTAQLEDSRLPCVPPVSVSVPRDYPATAPSCLLPPGHYDATPFLRRVGDALDARLASLPRKFSLSQLLDTWEMSVRQACSSQLPTPPTTSTLLMGL